MIKKIGERPNI